MWESFLRKKRESFRCALIGGHCYGKGRGDSLKAGHLLWLVWRASLALSGWSWVGSWGKKRELDSYWGNPYHSGHLLHGVVVWLPELFTKEIVVWHSGFLHRSEFYCHICFGNCLFLHSVSQEQNTKSDKQKTNIALGQINHPLLPSSSFESPACFHATRPPTISTTGFSDNLKLSSIQVDVTTSPKFDMYFWWVGQQLIFRERPACASHISSLCTIHWE